MELHSSNNYLFGFAVESSLQGEEKDMMQTNRNNHSKSSIWEKMLHTMAAKIEAANQQSVNSDVYLQQCIAIAKETLMELDQMILPEKFEDVAEEIVYYKSVRPKVEGQLIYQQICQLWEIKFAKRNQPEMLQKEQKRIGKFNRKHRFFYHYWRTGQCYLDDKLFVQHAEPFPLPIEDWNGAPVYVTQYDTIIARFYANDLLLDRISLMTNEARFPNRLVQSTTEDLQPLTWSASKAALVELVYALHSYGAFNNGNVEVKEIATHFEQSYQLDLGNYYRAFQEIRIRKKSRTNFIDQLKEKLEKRMDDADENPRY